MKNKEAEKYLKEIKRKITVGGKRKSEFLSGLSERVYEFCETNDYRVEELYSVFGSPDSIATEFLEAMPQSEIRKKMNIKRIVLFAILAVLLIYLAFIVISLIDVHQEAHGYYKEEILMITSFIFGGNIK